MRCPTTIAFATAQTATTETRPLSVTRFTTFGIGRSYLFKATGKKKAEAYWQELFTGFEGWSFDQLENYDKPLGESAILAFNAKTHPQAEMAIGELERALQDDLSSQLETTSIQVCFFTTGVAVMSMRLFPQNLGAPLDYLDNIQSDSKLERPRLSLRKIINCATQNYLTVIEKAEKDKRSQAGRGWSVKRYREVDRVDWKPKARHSFPLFFVTENLYLQRTASILQQVPSESSRSLQSDHSRVPYQGAEIYVDWSEALVKNARSNRKLIERNFIIAFASWFALVLMDKNSSLFLFEAHWGMIEKKHRSSAAAVHQRHMAYKDVSDASLPIRWTKLRRDLFLLETIHANWSSERWRNNIEERMKLLSLHYKSLEDDRNERATRRLGFIAAFLALVTLSSAIADVINLAEKGGKSNWLLTLVPPLLSIPFAALWFGLPRKVVAMIRKLIKKARVNPVTVEISEED